MQAERAIRISEWCKSKTLYAYRKNVNSILKESQLFEKKKKTWRKKKDIQNLKNYLDWKTENEVFF